MPKLFLFVYVKQFWYCFGMPVKSKMLSEVKPVETMLVIVFMSVWMTHLLGRFCLLGCCPYI